MQTLEGIRAKRQAILACAKRFGANAIRVFGSVSRGEARADSDLDLLVRFEANRSLVDQVALIQELGALLGIKVDVVDENGLSPYIRKAVLDEAVPL